MRCIAHVVNVFNGPLTSSAFVAQPATLESMNRAQQFARSDVAVYLLAAQLASEAPVTAPYLERLPDLDRTAVDVGKFQVQRRLPILRDILDRAYVASDDADFLVYSNIDIGVQPHFYCLVNDLIDRGYDAFIINRRTLGSDFATVADLPRSYAVVGEKHPGLDCFVFRRAAYSDFRLGHILIGAPQVGLSLAVNMACTAEKFEIFEDLHATFHWGNDAPWINPNLRDYVQHNRDELAQIVQHFNESPRLVAQPKIARWLDYQNLLPEALIPFAPHRVPLPRPRRSTTSIVKKVLGRVLPESVVRRAKGAYRGYRTATIAGRCSTESEFSEEELMSGSLKRIRSKDVFLISFPGSRLDDVRVLLARVVGQDHPKDFDQVNQRVPMMYTAGEWINEMNDPRVIGTHDPLFHLVPRSIYVVRDPRAVMVDLFRHKTECGVIDTSFDEFLRGDATHAPLNQGGVGLSWSQHVRSALRFSQKEPGRVLILRYEDLIAQPMEELERLIDFCELNSLELNLNEVIGEWGCAASDQSTDQGSSGVWKNLYEPGDLEYLSVQVSPVARELGYGEGTLYA